MTLPDPEIALILRNAARVTAHLSTILNALACQLERKAQPIAKPAAPNLKLVTIDEGFIPERPD